jgi:hypothetical protein
VFFETLQSLIAPSNPFISGENFIGSLDVFAHAHDVKSASIGSEV